MKNWREILVSPSTPILKAIAVIDAAGLQLALVADENNKLLGTVTDGDVRRGILRGVLLDKPVQEIMNPHPTFASVHDSRDAMLLIMRQSKVHHIPILDGNRCVVGLEVLDEILQVPQRKDNIVVLMAGGLGSRLKPLTDEYPKPLLKVGGRPILETILENFIEYGFNQFYITVNYKAELIKNYFGDGSNWGVSIRYLHEEKKLGTAGALGLLPERPFNPILVMNGDVLTKINFQQLMDFHMEHKAQATMCVREYDFQVPYGVVKVEKQRLVSIEEKPLQRFFVNAGVYLLEPEVLNFIPKDSNFDMPNLFERLVENKLETSVFPIREYWLDVGRIDDFERAEGEFEKVFR